MSRRRGEPEAATTEGLRVAFVHLDLGIGGAEQLIVQAAVGLVRKGHKVTLYTSHHDPGHCFPETIDGTLDVRVYGAFLPRTVFGKFTAFCAVLRMMFVCISLLVTGQRFNVIINDQVSAVNPILRLLAPRVLFYCHFPDLLLVQARGSVIKKLYRKPLDWLEEVTTGACSRVMVNSEFTRGVFYETFKSLANVDTEVLYPPVDLSNVEQHLAKRTQEKTDTVTQWKAFQEYASDAKLKSLAESGAPFFLSLNRYERKKNVGLALEAFALLDKESKTSALLVIAGGYDPRVTENVEYHKELEAKAKDAGLLDRVIFLRSISGELRSHLMENSVAVLYTPENEHFGIVPCEVMSLGVPVVACASGGPLESIEDGVTGILCPKGAPDFAAAMRKLLALKKDNLATWTLMGQKGRERVKRLFSLETFANRLHAIVVNE